MVIFFSNIGEKGVIRLSFCLLQTQNDTAINCDYTTLMNTNLSYGAFDVHLSY